MDYGGYLGVVLLQAAPNYKIIEVIIGLRCTSRPY